MAKTASICLRWVLSWVESRRLSNRQSCPVVDLILPHIFSPSINLQQLLCKGKGKGSFYIAQYPVRWTAQSALHSLPSLTDLFIPTRVGFFIQLSQQGRQWRERKCPIFQTVAKGDSNPGSLDCDSGVLPLSYRAPLWDAVVSGDVSIAQWLHFANYLHDCLLRTCHIIDGLMFPVSYKYIQD